MNTLHIYLDPATDKVERHNAYGWIKPDAAQCYLCGRKEFATPVDGFQVRECDNCERLLCERCAEIDCGGEGEGVQWQCSGDARKECQQIADTLNDLSVDLADHAPAMMFRVEKRSDADLTKVWTGSEWVYNSLRAKLYTEAERQESLNRKVRGEPNGFPEGGCWVPLEAERQLA